MQHMRRVRGIQKCGVAAVVASAGVASASGVGIGPSGIGPAGSIGRNNAAAAEHLAVQMAQPYDPVNAAGFGDSDESLGESDDDDDTAQGFGKRLAMGLGKEYEESSREVGGSAHGAPSR